MKWYKKNPERLEVEIRLIKTHHQGARIFQERGRIAVFSKFHGRKSHYLAKLIYPDDFPWEQPKVWIIEPRIRKAPHRWRDRSICLHGEQDGPRISGRIVLDRTNQWIKAYEEWCDTSKWPVL